MEDPNSNIPANSLKQVTMYWTRVIFPVCICNPMINPQQIRRTVSPSPFNFNFSFYPNSPHNQTVKHNLPTPCCLLVAHSCLTFFVTLWTVAHQAPLSMDISRQEYWSRLPVPSSRDLPDPGIVFCPLLSVKGISRSAMFNSSHRILKSVVISFVR